MPSPLRIAQWVRFGSLRTGLTNDCFGSDRQQIATAAGKPSETMRAVGLPDPIAAKFGDVLEQSLALPQSAFGFLQFSDIATNEEMLLFRFQPDPGPGQSNDLAQFVDIAAFEMACFPAAAGLTHFLPRAVQIFRIKKNRGDLAHHFIRVVAENRL